MGDWKIAAPIMRFPIERVQQPAAAWVTLLGVDACGKGPWTGPKSLIVKFSDLGRVPADLIITFKSATG